MIREITSENDAIYCDSLLTKLIQDERNYNDDLDPNFVVKDYFPNMIKKEGMILLGYYVSDVIVGYIFVKKIGDKTCLLDGLYVVEEYRHKGIASMLIDEAIKRIKELNMKYIDIRVMYNNEIAKKIYYKLGFNDFELTLRKEI